MEKTAGRFVEDFLEGKDFDKRKIYLFYAEGTDPDIIKKRYKHLEDKGFAEIGVGVLGCVMTVHGGKGAIGISAMEA